MKSIAYLIALLAISFTVLAQTASLTDAEVRKIDKGAGKITLKHGPIQNLEMPAMTMTFEAGNPAMLEKLKPGDKVRFAVEKAGDTYTVTRLEPAK